MDESPGQPDPLAALDLSELIKADIEAEFAVGVDRLIIGDGPAQFTGFLEAIGDAD